MDYLVKWRELPYEQAAWERDDMDIPGIWRQVEVWCKHELLYRLRACGDGLLEASSSHVRRGDSKNNSQEVRYGKAFAAIDRRASNRRGDNEQEVEWIEKAG